MIRRDRDDGKVEMMKTKVAMLISTAGVLVAGSAAALVNTQVLDSTTPSSALVIEATPSSDTVTTSGSVPLVTTPSGGTFTEVTTVGSATQASFAIGSAGTVVLDTAGDVLTIVSVNPASGWTVTKSEREDSTNVEIKLQSGSAEIEFHGNLLFGVVNTSVELHDDAVTGSSTDDTVTTSNTTNTSNSLPSTSVDDHGGDGGGDDHSGPGGGDDDSSGPGGGGDDSSGHGGGDDD